MKKNQYLEQVLEIAFLLTIQSLLEDEYICIR
jgi:hypothetical protein